MNKTKERIVGLDLFRILSMCGIIGLHIMGNGGVLANTNMYTSTYPFLILIYCLFYLSVNSFGVLSGYLGIEKRKNNYARLLELIAVILFFIVTETAVFYIFNINNVRAAGLKTLAKALFPFGVGYYWYITCYIFLFFLMPYINCFVKNLSQKTYKKLLVVLFALLAIVPNIFLQTDFFRNDNGYTALQLIFCYLIGGYFRLYPATISKSKIALRFGITIASMTIFNYLWRIATMKFFGHTIRDSWMINYISPLNIYASCLLLQFFSQARIKNKAIAKVLILLGSSAFSVYIFHDHYLFFNFVLKDIFALFPIKNAVLVIPMIFVAIVAIYLVGLVSDMIRRGGFKLLRLDNLLAVAGDKLNKKMDIKDEK